MRVLSALVKYLFLLVGNLVPGFKSVSGLKAFLYKCSGVRIERDAMIVGPIKVDYTLSYDALSSIAIGQGTYIGRDFRVSTYKSEISIGKFCQIASEVSLETNTHAIEERSGPYRVRIQKPIVIHDGVWIGSRALILPGVTIGRNAIVAGGSVVTKDVPDDTLVGGSPARIIRSLQSARADSCELRTPARF